VGSKPEDGIDDVDKEELKDGANLESLLRYEETVFVALFLEGRGALGEGEESQARRSVRRPGRHDRHFRR